MKSVVVRMSHSILRFEIVGQQSNVDEIRMSEWGVDTPSTCGNLFDVASFIRIHFESLSFAYDTRELGSRQT